MFNTLPVVYDKTNKYGWQALFCPKTVFIELIHMSSSLNHNRIPNTNIYHPKINQNSQQKQKRKRNHSANHHNHHQQSAMARHEKPQNTVSPFSFCYLAIYWTLCNHISLIKTTRTTPSDTFIGVATISFAVGFAVRMGGALRLEGKRMHTHIIGRLRMSCLVVRGGRGMRMIFTKSILRLARAHFRRPF